jgi:phosphoenolpyruvate-protein kinase (PTS system EI component)
MARALQGVPASGGRASGPVHVVLDRPASIPIDSDPISQFGRAVRFASAELEAIAARCRAGNPESADVLEAQGMLVQDPSLEEDVRRALARGGTLGDAVTAVFEVHARALEGLGDSPIGSRAGDIREAARHVLFGLAGLSAARLSHLEAPAVVVARDLSPADILAVAPDLLLAIVTETGGLNAHAAIVARELGVPAVMRVEGAVQALAGAAGVEVDGETGTVLARGEPVTAVRASAGERLDPEGLTVRIMANVGSLAAARLAAGRGAMGIGLLRTELLLLGRGQPVGEAEQLEVYAGACGAMDPHPVVVRTLDIGSDKALPGLTAREPNPALGRRGIRLWLARPQLARAQVRALLRCHRDHANLRVLLPMIAAAEEVRAARALFEAEAAAIGASVPPLGIMVETPAAALQMAEFAGLVDFASLGTNDLAQYTLAADRELEWGEELSERNPGVRRVIEISVREARAAGIEVGACGEMAGTPSGASMLVEFGVESLSMATSSMAAVAQALRRASTADARPAGDS